MIGGGECLGGDHLCTCGLTYLEHDYRILIDSGSISSPTGCTAFVFARANEARDVRRQWPPDLPIPEGTFAILEC